ncbi:MAG: hypothetical protein OD811_01205 [Alphaproteobacteria bacterium]
MFLEKHPGMFVALSGDWVAFGSLILRNIDLFVALSGDWVAFGSLILR